MLKSDLQYPFIVILISQTEGNMLIELGKGTKNIKQFTEWLEKQGHEVDPPKTYETYIDGDPITSSSRLYEIFYFLKQLFENETI